MSFGRKKSTKAEKETRERKKAFTRKLLLEICISFLKESWAAGTQKEEGR